MKMKQKFFSATNLGRSSRCCMVLRFAAAAVLACDCAVSAAADEVTLMADGGIDVKNEGGVAELRAYATRSQWWAAYAMADKKVPERYRVDPARFVTSRRHVYVNGTARQDGTARAVWEFEHQGQGDKRLEFGLECMIPHSRCRGFRWKMDGNSGGRNNMPRKAMAGSLAVSDKDDTIFDVKFDRPVEVQIYERGAEAIVVRIGRALADAKEPGKFSMGMEFLSKKGVKFSAVPGTRITAKPGVWERFEPSLEIEPGSALDFSALRNTDGPCGKHGRVIVNKRGEFAFADKPDERVVFNGVNLCFSALFTERDKTDILLDRLVRLGYNSVRIHHYEPDMVTPWRATGFNWNPENVDRLHYFVAACSKRGLYLTTDLYVFRAVAWRQIGRDKDGECPNSLYKLYVPGDEAALEDFKKFTLEAFGAVSKYTGKRLCDDPAWATLCLINEPDVPSQEVWKLPDWIAKWEKFLKEKHPAKTHLKLGDMRNPESLRLGRQFHAHVEVEFAERMRKFLAEKLDWRLPISDMNINGCDRSPEMHGARQKALDYVDMHYYADHPVGVGLDPFGLPNTSKGITPALRGAEEFALIGSSRIFGRPFVASEWNWCAPSPHRAAGSLLFAAFAAAQRWDGLWRFSYDNRAEGMFTPKPARFFYLSADPLMLTAERFTHFFFTLGDIAPMERRVAIEANPEDLMDWGPDARKSRTASFKQLPTAAYAGRIGLKARGAAEPGDVVIPFEKGGDAAYCREALKAAGMEWFDNLDSKRISNSYLVTDPETEAIAIDAPRAAGIYSAQPGLKLKASKAGLEVSDATVPTTVAIASLDRKELRKSSRMLLTHLTDLKNTNQAFTDPALRTMNELGTLPYLVRVGTVRVRLAVESGCNYKCMALGASGKRLGEIPVKTLKTESGAQIELELSNSAAKWGTAVLAYELVKADD